MPTYIDRHPLTAVPRAVRNQMHLEAVQGLIDKHGAQPLGHWVTDGVIYCVLRAPSEAAVCRHHADRGLPCDDLHPISPQEKRSMQAVAAQLWPADLVGT
jgi:hypothetical protein